MAQFKVHLVLENCTATADVFVEAENLDEAADRACGEMLRNHADWVLSEGNYIGRDDVYVPDNGVEEILPPCVKGDGFDPRVGGFANLIIDGQTVPVSDVVDAWRNANVQRT